MIDLGYGQDVYKLVVLSHREKDELMGMLHMLPGHKERFANLFKMIEQLNPKSQVQKMLNSYSKEPQVESVRRPRSGSRGRTSTAGKPSGAESGHSLGSQIVFDPDQTKAYIAQLKDRDTRAGKIPPKFVPAQPKSSSRNRHKKTN